MKTITFSNGYVGIKLESVSEIMKYNALGNIFSICNEYEYYFDEYVEEDDGNDNYTEREPTEGEKLERILQAFRNGDELYATFWLDCGKIVPDAAITLQTDFRVGQEVYVMHNNKVTKAIIKQLVLIEGESSPFPSSNTMASDFSSTFYQRCNERYTNEPTQNYIRQEIDRVRTPEHSSACVKIDGRYMFVELAEVFATKEDLVKHLMEE